MAKITNPGYTENRLQPQDAPKVDPGMASAGGQMFAKLGEGLGDVAQQLQRAHSLAEQTEAQNYAEVEFKKLQIERDQDQDTSIEKHKSYAERAKQISEAASQKLSIPQDRDFFKMESDQQASIVGLEMDGSLRKKVVSNAKANLDIFMEAQRSTYITSANPKIKEMAIIRREKKLDQMVEAGFLSKEDGVTLRQKAAQEWPEGQAKNDAYTDPGGFLQKEAQGFYKGVDPKNIESLRNTAEKLVKVNKDDEQKNISISQNQAEESIGALTMSKASKPEVAAALDSLHQRGDISDEHYNIAKQSLEVSNIGESKTEALISLMLQYSKIPQETDPVKAQRNFRNEVFAKKAMLSEKRFNELLNWSGSKQVEMNTPKMNGLQKLLNHFKKDKSLSPEHTKNLMSVVDKYITDQYKPGQKLSKGGREFEVIQKDDGSIGFKEI